MNEDKNIYSAKDTLDINELASLNDDISIEFIEQLQNQVSIDASKFTGKPVSLSSSDADLFEEPTSTLTTTTTPEPVATPEINTKTLEEEKEESKAIDTDKQDSASTKDTNNNSTETATSVPKEPDEIPVNNEIGDLTKGNIIEKTLTKEQIDYNESLDYLDGNKKYSKYVIYIDQENTEFIESLTVKERKNLINRILREQDDIAITKRRLTLVQTIIKHSIVAIVTITIAIPVIYFTINASLEASINNYRRSQTIFKTLYKEKGKIKSPKAY